MRANEVPAHLLIHFALSQYNAYGWRELDTADFSAVADNRGEIHFQTWDPAGAEGGGAAAVLADSFFDCDGASGGDANERVAIPTAARTGSTSLNFRKIPSMDDQMHAQRGTPSGLDTFETFRINGWGEWRGARASPAARTRRPRNAGWARGTPRRSACLCPKCRRCKPRGTPALLRSRD